MEDLKKLIGERLREIRLIFNGGFKLSTSQFADILGETKFNISNYEAGKANIPPRLLVALYEHGFNPTYILTGNGAIFAENEPGIRLSERINGSAPAPNANLISGIDFSSLSNEQLIHQASQLNARAGDIMKYLSTKSEDKQ
jgi:hypothetical protein